MIADNPLAQINPREAQVLHFLGAGMSFAEIAKLIRVSSGTIINDTAVMRHKLGVRSNKELVRLAAEISARLPS